jgi:hypothetical protein
LNWLGSSGRLGSSRMMPSPPLSESRMVGGITSREVVRYLPCLTGRQMPTLYRTPVPVKYFACVSICTFINQVSNTSKKTNSSLNKVHIK